ncbi:tRNA (guanosine(46)-N7)-methyltransferase TrmB [Compostibacter hankyongensis]|uniref:tRNA (guanine-N(7)-)-methyltransferase n=1 Tax=Compostibacter hankyongensis TaxID=1007089 RepID=A0ABP8FE23_9BACT
MGHNKLIRFEEILHFPNVLIYPEQQAGRWAEHFGNNHPVTLELACGKGDYTLALARRFPEENFIGVDIKGNRIWKGARTALDEGLRNVAFLRTQIGQLPAYFAPGEVKEIWITFPDPFLRKSKAKKRLTHPVFLHRYQQVLTPGGMIHLKTDSPELYAFTREVISENGCILAEDIPDVYALPAVPPLLDIRTFYESMHLAAGRTIRYLRFSLPDRLPPLPVKKQHEHGDAEILQDADKKQ